MPLQTDIRSTHEVQARDTGVIGHSMNSLDEAIGDLENVIMVLRARLGPVLAPSNPTRANDADLKADLQMSDISAFLVTRRNRVGDLREILANVLEDLEL